MAYHNPFVKKNSIFFTCKPVEVRDDKSIDSDTAGVLGDFYYVCIDNLIKYFTEKRIDGILYDKLFDINEYIKRFGNYVIKVNISGPDKFILELSKIERGVIKEIFHISLFTRNNRHMGLHFTIPDQTDDSRIYVSHSHLENSLCEGIKADKYFFSNILKTVGFYFKNMKSIDDPTRPLKARINNFITDLKILPEERIQIGEILLYIGQKYYDDINEDIVITRDRSRSRDRPRSRSRDRPRSRSRDRPRSRSRDRPRSSSRSRDRRRPPILVGYNNNRRGGGDKQLKINKIKDKIKLLKNNKIKNKDKIIKLMKLIEDIKTKIKIEKELAKLKQKNSIVKRKTPMVKKPKAISAKSKTSSSKTSSK